MKSSTAPDNAGARSHDGNDLRRRLTRNLGAVLPFSVALVATAIVYFPLTRVYFWADDLAHFITIANRGFFYFLLSDAVQGHYFILSSLALYVPKLLFGLHAEPYGWLTLGVHLLNVALLFRVARGLSGNAAVAGLAALLWGVCPLHSEVLGWYCVNGHAFCATALLLVLERLSSTPTIQGRTAALWAFILWCGAVSFGIGIGVALAFPVALLFIAPVAFKQSGVKWAFAAMGASIVGSYALARLLYTWHFESPPLAANLLSAVMFLDVRPIISMMRHLIAVGVVGLLQGPSFIPNQDPVRPIFWWMSVYTLVLAG